MVTSAPGRQGGSLTTDFKVTMMPLHRRISITVIAGAGAMLMAAAVAWACVPQATIELDRTQAAVGEHVDGTGRGFDVASSVEVHLGGVDGPLLWSGSTVSGEFAFTFEVPAGTAAGHHVVSVHQTGRDGDPARAVLEVTQARADAGEPAAATSDGGDGAEAPAEQQDADPAEAPPAEQQEADPAEAPPAPAEEPRPQQDAAPAAAQEAGGERPATVEDTPAPAVARPAPVAGAQPAAPAPAVRPQEGAAVSPGASLAWRIPAADLAQPSAPTPVVTRAPVDAAGPVLSQPATVDGVATTERRTTMTSPAGVDGTVVAGLAMLGLAGLLTVAGLVTAVTARHRGSAYARSRAG